MTAFKDWNEAYVGGERVLEAADNTWMDAHLQSEHRCSNFSGFSNGDDPLPLTRSMPPAAAFPVAALGQVMADAANAFHAKTQAPMDICGNAVLAVAGLAAQAHADIVLPTKEVKPLSLYLVTIAPSGERKTSTDSLALVPVREREMDLRQEHEAARIGYENAHAAWDAQRKFVLANRKLDLASKKNALDSLGPEPRGPLSPILVCHEPTFEGLAKLLANGQPSVGIFASEGGAFIGGHGFSEEAKLRTAAGLSLLWDDGRLTRVRATEGVTALAGRRVALHLQAQPDVAARVFSDPVLADQGLLSRILVIAPDTRQGQRFWKDVSPEADKAASVYVEYVNRLLRRPMPLKEGTRNELQPRPVPLSPEARQLWIEFADDVERKLGPLGDLQPISGFAAKLAEHAARIAGVLAMFENPDAANVDAAALQNGITLSRHYAAAALRLHGQSRLNDDLAKAKMLLEWARLNSDRGLVSLPDIVQTGPNRIRETPTARKLAEILVQHRQFVRVQGGAIVNGKERREVWRVAGVSNG
jgi:hypothetical protein